MHIVDNLKNFWDHWKRCSKKWTFDDNSLKKGSKKMLNVAIIDIFFKTFVINNNTYIGVWS